MKPSWDPSFQPLLKYIKIVFLPPFTSNPKLGYISSLGNCFFFIRSLILLSQTEKGLFAETFCIFTMTAQYFFKAITTLYNKKSFENHFIEMNKFIKDTKFNPVIKEENHFLKIWQSNPVFKHGGRYIKFMIAIIIFWELQIFHDLTKNLNNVKYSYYALYSPYFDYNSYTKVGYTLMDVLLDWNAFFTGLHNDVLFMVFLNFLHSQYVYLKKLFDIISVEKENDTKIKKWWIQNHVLVLR